jgi:hypothetical protein
MFILLVVILVLFISWSLEKRLDVLEAPQRELKWKQANEKLRVEREAARFEYEEALRRKKEEEAQLERSLNPSAEQIAWLLKTFTTKERLARGIWLSGEQITLGAQPKKAKRLLFGEYAQDEFNRIEEARLAQEAAKYGPK